jgi:hypothetical protein
MVTCVWRAFGLGTPLAGASALDAALVAGCALAATGIVAIAIAAAMPIPTNAIIRILIDKDSFLALSHARARWPKTSSTPDKSHCQVSVTPVTHLPGIHSMILVDP